MNYTVHHEPDSHRFVASVEGEEAYVVYEPHGEDRWVMAHTYTPTALRGRGIAAEVVRTALEIARAEGKSVVPACWYVEGFIHRHPEFQDLVADSDS
ncbi:MAG: GNAT family N-acetyltransferase [Alkalispirochaeta sp.]